jgi:hypothetical protein
MRWYYFLPVFFLRHVLGCPSMSLDSPRTRICLPDHVHVLQTQNALICPPNSQNLQKSAGCQRCFEKKQDARVYERPTGCFTTRALPVLPEQVDQETARSMV